MKKHIACTVIVALVIFASVALGAAPRVHASEKPAVAVGSFGFCEHTRSTMAVPSVIGLWLDDFYCIDGTRLNFNSGAACAAEEAFREDVRWKMSGHIPGVDELDDFAMFGTLSIGKVFTPRTVTVTAYLYSNPTVYSTIVITADPYMPVVTVDDIIRFSSGRPERAAASFTVRNIPLQDLNDGIATAYMFMYFGGRNLVTPALLPEEAGALAHEGGGRHGILTPLLLEGRICSITHDSFVVRIEFDYDGGSVNYSEHFRTGRLRIPLGTWYYYGVAQLNFYAPDGNRYVHWEHNAQVMFLINSPRYTPSSWAHGYIWGTIFYDENLVPTGLQYNFTQPITRAEFAALGVALYERIHGEITGRATFTDTTDANVEKLSYIGVIDGVGGGRFAPDSPLTREQAAVLIARLSEAIGWPLPEAAAAFADNAGISPWAIDYVGKVQAAGIMGGAGNNMFSPQGAYTREQSIASIWRLVVRMYS